LLHPDKAVVRPLLPSISWEIAQFIPRDRQISAVGQAFLEVIRAEIDLLKEQKFVV
jgi:hypothetical protein